MPHAAREHATPRLLVLDRQPEPRTVSVSETATSRRARGHQRRQALDPPTRARHRRAYTVVIVVTALLAVLLLLAGSPAGAFVSGLVAGSVWLARYFHAVATQHD